MDGWNQEREATAMARKMQVERGCLWKTKEEVGGIVVVVVVVLGDQCPY